ncbi:putative amidohydrolase YtcJ [Tritrichomonas foetus]|uniref:Amidohydrolase YtcJ n=1 Tax=Tritrichomonas foetus TaxID=1144522 RepID=A0A1J4JAV1_9EUKA|nr:putative amidohydrolase YtcJ [Tritrichomonas foetus]|eukprot:OHS95359.1 putative amidohydrolase YtcJ [Tritrichomonas foetus]
MKVIENALIWPGHGKQFQGALIINDKGLIEEVGTIEKVKLNPNYEKCEKIDANGCTVIPAFTDSHCHLAGIVRGRCFIDLSEANSMSEAIQLLADSAQKVSTDSNLPWIFGGKFNETRFPDNKIPNRYDLDIIQNPVIIQRICCHLHIINSAALKIIGAHNFDGYEGAEIDDKGELNGILHENSCEPIMPYIDDIELSDDDFTTVFNEFLSYGVSEVHTVGASGSGLSEKIYQYQKMKSQNNLPIKIVCYMDQEMPIGSYLGDDFISYGGFKIFMDGSLGAQTAALRKNYNCCDSNGVLIHSDEEVEQILKKANSKMQQVMAHCIGDRGIEQIVRACEKVEPIYPVKLTHVQICPKDLIEKISKLKIFCDVQMHMLVSDDPLLEKWIGKERVPDVFPINSLIKAGVTVTGSSDAPVEPFNPMTGIWAAVVRTENTCGSENISLEDALKMYTVNAQKLVRREERKGTLETGKVADIAIFDCDIFQVDPQELKNCKVVKTIVNGEIKYQRE